MQNLLTKRNIIIAGGVFLFAIVLIIFLSGGSEDGENNGFFGGLFPSIGTEVDTGDLIPPPPVSSEVDQVIGDVVIQLPVSAGQAAAMPKGSLVLLSNAPLSIDGGTAPINANSPISGYIVVEDDVLYHKNIPENLGHVFKRRIDGTNSETRISNLTIPQIIKVDWSKDGKDAIAYHTVNEELRKLRISYSADEELPETEFLPLSVTATAFSPDSRSMAFRNDLETTQNVFIAKYDFTSPRKLMDNNVPNLEIAWPAQNNIALKTKSSYALPGYLYSINTSNGSLSKVAEGRGLDAVWRGDGEMILYSESDQRGNLLNLKAYDLKKEEAADLGIKTIAEKCIFSAENENFAYCAVPIALPITTYPDAFWQGKITTLDSVVKINLRDKEMETILTSFSEIIDPRVSADDEYLLFKDKKTGYLWSLKLK